mmetsp:Transcript_2882/g.10433  ORF Transcript_2882/g.10433 Transcript_2882/m.10433 type:complete len:126 (-) Transcript_2882:205-582(-)
MPFRRFVEVGRIALCNYGPDYGKLVCMVQIIDQNRVLVDAPGMKRSVMTYKRLSLTDMVIPIEAACDAEALKAAWEEADVQGKWDSSAWGKKLAARRAKKAMTDFERYKAVVAKTKRAAAIRKAM